MRKRHTHTHKRESERDRERERETERERERARERERGREGGRERAGEAGEVARDKEGQTDLLMRSRGPIEHDTRLLHAGPCFVGGL